MWCVGVGAIVHPLLSAWTCVALDSAVWKALVGGAKLFSADPRELTLKAGDGAMELLDRDSTSRFVGSSDVFDLGKKLK